MSEEYDMVGGETDAIHLSKHEDGKYRVVLFYCGREIHIRITKERLTEIHEAITWALKQ